ncbi:MAG: hypothetical protein BRC40_13970 [Cyanobacteria bacterium QH_8_48_120]|nr:MAG: hypothetical protein BRC40_13970 [Cyanobacteria bacterium QH_8_48_120]
MLGAQGPNPSGGDHRTALRLQPDLDANQPRHLALPGLRFQGRFTTEVFLDFLRCLVRSVPRKVFLIVDRHSVHRAHRVQQWVSQHSDQLELFYLPPYSHERNPDEYLNQDIKANATR